MLSQFSQEVLPLSSYQHLVFDPNLHIDRFNEYITPDTVISREVYYECNYYNYKDVTYKLSDVYDRDLGNLSLNIRSIPNSLSKIEV